MQRLRTCKYYSPHSMSTTKAIKRVEAVIETIESWGYLMPDGRRMIAFWDLAYHLNNNWYAETFLVKSNTPYDDHFANSGDGWAAKSFAIWDYRRGIKHACRNSERLEFITQKDRFHNVYFIILNKAVLPI